MGYQTKRKNTSNEEVWYYGHSSNDEDGNLEIEGMPYPLKNEIIIDVTF